MEEKNKGKLTPPWQPGTSGNPRGRPKGSGIAGKLRAAIAKSAPEIVVTLIEQAKAGDTAAAKLLLERCCAAFKPGDELVSITLPEGSLSEKGRAVLAAVAAGELAPTQASALLTGIAALGRTIELDEMLRRVEALEARNAQS